MSILRFDTFIDQPGFNPQTDGVDWLIVTAAGFVVLPDRLDFRDPATRIDVAGTVTSDGDVVLAATDPDTRLRVEATGRIEGRLFAAVVLGDRATVANAGTIFGYAGLLVGADASVTNAGTLEGSELAALEAAGIGLRVDNTGRIIGGIDAVGGSVFRNAGLVEASGAPAIDLVSGGNSLVNAGSLFAVDGPAVRIATTAPGGTNALENTGRIETLAGETAIALGADTDSLRNAGLIRGDVTLGAGADRFDGAGGTVEGGVFGGEGNDRLLGGDAADLLHGGRGADTVAGGAGNDTIEGGGGADWLDGGAGIDTLSYRTFANGVVLRIAEGVGLGGHAAGDRFAGFEAFEGSRGDDQIVAGDVGVALRGGGGDDLILGGAGRDTLHGDGGDDTIAGGIGDLVYGGSGADVFRFQGTGGAFLGRIGDYDATDVIDLLAFNPTDKPWSFIGDPKGGFSGPRQVRATVRDGVETVVEIETDADGVADFTLLLDGVVVLTATDFLL